MTADDQDHTALTVAIIKMKNTKQGMIANMRIQNKTGKSSLKIQPTTVYHTDLLKKYCEF